MLLPPVCVCCRLDKFNFCRLSTIRRNHFNHTTNFAFFPPSLSPSQIKTNYEIEKFHAISPWRMLRLSHSLAIEHYEVNIQCIPFSWVWFVIFDHKFLPYTRCKHIKLKNELVSGGIECACIKKWQKLRVCEKNTRRPIQTRFIQPLEILEPIDY